MNFSQADITENSLELRLREAAIGGIDEALRVWTEAAKTKEAALLEREIKLRELQQTLEQNRQDCQAWEDRLTILESHLREREEKINEREQTLEKALQHFASMTPKAGHDMEISAGGDLRPSAHQIEDSKLDDDRFSLRSMAYSMTPSVIPSIYSSIADSDTVDLRSTGMSELSVAYNALSRRQQHVLSRHTLQWRDLDSRKSLTWSDIPWPTFTELVKPEELKQEEVRAYLELLGTFGYYISPKWLEPQTPVSYGSGMHQSIRDASNFLAEYIALWHPDRLEVRVLNRVVEWDRERVRIHADKVAGILRDIARADARMGVDLGTMQADRPALPRQESAPPEITSAPSIPRLMDSSSNGTYGVKPLLPTNLGNLRAALLLAAGGKPPSAPPGTNGAPSSPLVGSGTPEGNGATTEGDYLYRARALYARESSLCILAAYTYMS
jgi:hypothetical protein